MTPQQKVAALLVFLGEELAADILRGLPEAQARKVLQSLSHLPAVSTTEMEQVCQEMLALLSDSNSGARFAFPRQQFSPEAGKRLLEAARKSLGREVVFEGSSEAFLIQEIRELLEALPVEPLARYLAGERPTVMAVCLCLMPPGLAARVFQKLPASRHLEVMQAIVHMQGVESSVFEVLHEELQKLRKSHSGAAGQNALGGVEKLADVLQNTEGALRSSLLERLAERDETLALEIGKRLLSPQRLAELMKPDLAKLLSAISDKDLALVLKGFMASEIQLRDVYLSAMSSGRRASVEDALQELEHRPVRRSEVSEAQTRLTQCAVRLRDEGKIVFPWEEQLVG